MSLSGSARGLSLAAGCGTFFLLLASCSSDANSVIAPPAGGTAGAVATGGSTMGGGGAAAVAGAPAAGAPTTAGTSAGGASAAGAGGAPSGGGGAGGGGGSGGSAGSAGTSGSAGMSGGAGAASCTPGTPPATGTMYTRTDWKAQWNIPCNFNTQNPPCSTLTPTNAFDGKNDTRTSLGDTNGTNAQKIGDAFTFDMNSCNLVGKLVMWTDGPPNNMNGNDTRDYPGKADVTVSSDCTTAADGTISGTFGPMVVATASEPQPGCSGGTACSMPMTFTVTPPVAAKCIRITLTQVLKLATTGSPGIWWGIGELDVFPP